MSSVESLIAQLNKLRIDHMCGAIAAPRDKTEYEFGRICGYEEAMAAALELINSILEEDDPDVKTKHSKFGRPLIGD